MGNRFLNTVFKHKGTAAGVVGGLMLGAAVAGAAVSGFGSNGYDGATLLKTAEVKPVAPPAGAPMSFADIIDHVSPAVVSIETKGKAQMPQGGLPSIPGFEFRMPEQSEAPEVRGAGSGFLISADGYIVTNNHVIENADEITVELTNKTKLKATVIGRDAGTDLAVIKVDGHNFPFVSFETDSRPRVGDWVIAVGNPFGLSGTATAGIVSAFGRPDGAQGYVEYMQIDAAINRGNSGGPTFDLNGRVIGVNSAIITPSGANAGVGFAIPADTANAITSKLIAGGKIERGYIGVSILPVTDDIAESLALADKDGAYIADMAQGGPAEKAGIQAGDIVKKVNGETIKTSTDLTRRVADVRPGEKVTLEVLRNGKMVKLTITAALRPSEDELARGLGNGTTAPDARGLEPVLGIKVAPIDAEARRSFGLNDTVNGLVVVEVDTASDAGKKGLNAGDVIVRANNLPVTSRESLNKIVADLKTEGRPSVLLLVNRAGRNFPVPLTLK